MITFSLDSIVHSSELFSDYFFFKLLEDSRLRRVLLIQCILMESKVLTCPVCLDIAESPV